MSRKRYDIDYCDDCEYRKKSGLGKALLRILGVGIVVGAALIGGAEKLGEEVLHEEDLPVQEIKD